MSEPPEEVRKGREILSEVRKGPWPNFLREADHTRYPIDLYGASLYLKRDLWTTGGYVSVPGAPTGILMRVTSRPDIGESANVVRVLLPSGNFVTSDMLDKLADFADKYGVGMLHAITTGHNVEIPGIPKDRIREFVSAFKDAGMEIGSTGDAFRNTTACIGQVLCEYANTDTLDVRDKFYDRYNDYAKYPTFPHKVKLKISGCPLDCARATQKADIGIVGSWKNAPLVDKEKMKELSAESIEDIIRSCPTGAVRASDGSVSISSKDCTQCMICLRKGNGAITPGKRKQFLIYVGGKLRGKKGPLSSKLLARVDSIGDAMDLMDRIVEVFTDHAARKERLGDLIFRIGMKGFLDLMKMKPAALNVKDLRTNLFYAVNEDDRQRIPEEIGKIVRGE